MNPMENPEEHIFNVEPLEDGRYEAVCPDCGRIVIVRMHPFEKETLNEGDIKAIHVFTLGNLKLSAFIDDNPSLGRAVDEALDCRGYDS